MQVGGGFGGVEGVAGRKVVLILVQLGRAYVV